MKEPVRQRAESAGAAPLPAVSWRAVAVVVTVLSVFDITLGLSFPLLSLIMEARGYDAATIGLNAATTSVGVMVVAPFVPAVVRRVGPFAFSVSCLLATAVIFAGFKVFDGLAVWYLLRFLLGATTGALFTVTEAWINELSTPETRGRVIAIYSSMLSLGFAAGPLVLTFTGTVGWMPFVVGLALIGLCLVFLIAERSAVPAQNLEERPSIWSFLPLAPALLLAVGVFAVIDTSVMSLFPLYGLRNGLDETTTAYALTVLIAGNILLQFPIGWLSDQVGRRVVMIACALITGVGGLILPHVVQSPWLWPLVFVWGSTGFGVYTMALAELGDRFTGSRLLTGTAAFAVMWGVGGIAGPALVGGAMEVAGPNGLPYSLAACFFLFGLYAAWRWRNRT